MTYKTGTIGEFMKWTKSVVADPVAAQNTPRRWFDSDATAAKTISAEAMIKLLSAENIALLQAIALHQPHSVTELAKISHRKVSNLSLTLKKLRDAGIIDLMTGPRKRVIPRLTARKVTLELDLAGPQSAVKVEQT